jgi:cytochrome c556
MRTIILSLGLAGALLGSALSAQFEVTDDGMRDIEDVTKSLDSNVALQQGHPASAEVREIIAFFKQVEAYYARQPDKADAVVFSRQTHELGAQILQALEAGNYDGAASGVSALTRSCKGCHDVYK